jgi:hypothetical protein
LFSFVLSIITRSSIFFFSLSILFICLSFTFFLAGNKKTNKQTRKNLLFIFYILEIFIQSICLSEKFRMIVLMVN